jgi:hypothetical protein
VFAAIWWVWMAFTWFANVFDCDDEPYRLLMVVMIAGSLGQRARNRRHARGDGRVRRVPRAPHAPAPAPGMTELRSTCGGADGDTPVDAIKHYGALQSAVRHSA